MSKALTQDDLYRVHTVKLNMPRSTVIRLLEQIDLYVDSLPELFDDRNKMSTFRITGKIVVPKNKKDFSKGFEFVRLVQTLVFSDRLENDKVREHIQGCDVNRILYQIQEKFGAGTKFGSSPIPEIPPVFQSSMWMQKYLEKNPLYKKIYHEQSIDRGTS